MPIDTTIPQSPGWWIKRLARKLNGRQARLELLNSHYRGDPPLPRAFEGQREIYRRFVKNARINYAKLIAEAPRHRMIPTGMVCGDDEADALLAEWWIKNGMPVETTEVHRSMFSMGDGYAMIGWDDEDGVPTVTSEDPRQCITEHDPVRQRRRLAGLKIYHDDINEEDVAYLFLPGRRYVAHKPTRSAAKAIRFNATAWDWKEEAGGEDGEVVPGKAVPLVRFRNERGVAEFEDHLGHLDRINDDLLHRMTISSLQAFRQRAIKGVPTHYPENHPDPALRGKEIDYADVFPADPGAMWLLPLTAELWESGVIDITPLISASKYDAQQLAAVSFTPLHYFSPDAAQGSAEGVTAQRENLVFKVEDRIQRATDGWAEVSHIQLLFWYAEQGFTDDEIEQLDIPAAKPQWMPPERHSLAERYDANIKAKAGDVPWKTRMLKVLQFTPDEVADMEAERMDDQLLFPELTSVVGATPPQPAPGAPAPAPQPPSPAPEPVA